MNLVELLLFVCWVYFSVFFHEMGHWLMAKALRMITSHVEIGSGSLMFQIVVWHDNWRFYWEPFPSTGSVTLFPSSRWWKNFWVAAAGPIASLFLAIVAWWMFSFWFAIVPLSSGLANLVPFKREKIKSDGYRMRQAWRGK